MEKGPVASETVNRVMCNRTGSPRTVEEHTSCPYCYGRAREVETGDRGQFCDYQPDRDPVAFGFPEGTSRESE
jgi:hypothetical protein